MNQKKITLRHLAGSIYERKALKTSDCYEFTELVDAYEIWVSKDGYSQTAADVLKTAVEQKYHHQVSIETKVIIPLCVEKHMRQSQKYNVIIICNQSEARQIDEILMAQSAQDNSLVWVCEAREVIEDEIEDAVDMAPMTPRYKDPLQLKSACRAFKKKQLKAVDYLVVYASAVGTWVRAAYLWHEIFYKYDISPQVMIVDDLSNWADKKTYAYFRKRLYKMLRRLNVGAYCMDVPRETTGLILDWISGSSAIVVMPQLKSHTVSEFRKLSPLSRQISFFLCEQDLDEEFEVNGKIGTQNLYNEIVKFSLLCPDNEDDGLFRYLYQAKIFSGWQMRLYWLGRKINTRIYTRIETIINKSALRRRY